MENKNEIITANASYITRTFAHSLVKFSRTSLTLKDGKPEMVTEEIARQFKGKITAEQAMEKIQKDCAGCIITVSSVDYIEEVRGMKVEDFLKYSIRVQRPESQQKEG